MKTLYLDCSMGASGDMLTAALLELLPDPDAFIEQLNSIGIPHVVYKKSSVQKCGITGTHISVLADGVDESELMEHPHAHEEHHHEHRHEHSSMEKIGAVLSGLAVSDKVKADALEVYRLIAEAESHVHNCPVSEIHFHEVGTLDAVADVTAVCLLMEKIAPDSVVASPVHVGSGTVHCAHGILPVPAPATACILQDVPVYGGEIKGELCTPTGAALLKHFVGRFASMPVMRVHSVGYGMGNKDFPVANCLRAMLGDTEDRRSELRYELSANVDDMTAEQISFAAEQLFAAGAVEVYTLPVGMKKSRPGTLIRAIVANEKKEAVISAFFRHTTTIGVRETETKRYVLTRSVEKRQTSYGEVRIKRSEGYGVVKEKLEFEDLARIAREQGIPLAEAKEKVEREIGRNG